MYKVQNKFKDETKWNDYKQSGKVRRFLTTKTAKAFVSRQKHAELNFSKLYNLPKIQYKIVKIK